MKQTSDPVKSTQMVFSLFGALLVVCGIFPFVAILVFSFYFIFLGFIFADGDTIPEIFMMVPFVIIGLIYLFVIYKYIKIIKKHNSSSLDEAYLDDKDIINRCFDVLVLCQKAWINNDNAKLKELVSKDVFNDYQTKTDEEKNEGVEHYFKLKDAKILSREGKKEDAYETIKMRMEVIEYSEEYVANRNSEVSKATAIRMKKYNLEFMIYHNDTINCPNCAAPIPKGATVCEYCKSPVEIMAGKIVMIKKEMIK